MERNFLVLTELYTLFFKRNFYYLDDIDKAFVVAMLVYSRKPNIEHLETH